jgi:Holliday junction resolvase-like predicted endonuclease
METGRRSEARVCAFLRENGWREIEHNMRCAHVQIDIVARSSEGLLTVIEVKTGSPSGGFAHVSRRQMSRLARVAALLAESEPVEIRLAFVEGDKVRLLPADGLTDF